MSCRFKIKEAFNSYTDTEKRLAEYILKNKELVVNLSAQELGENIEGSAAAVVRFSKKIGYKGFTALKVALAKDTDEDDEEKIFDEIIREEDSVELIVKKAIASNMNTVIETEKLINTREIEQAIKALINCNNIYLFGVGGSGVVCNDFLHKLARINMKVVHYDDIHIMLASVAHISKNDVALAISYGGETKEINIALKYAKAAGATTIAITQFNSKSQLSKLTDILLHIPKEEKSLRLGAIASRNSSLILTDILYYGIAKENLSQTIGHMVKTRDLIKELK